MTDKFAILMTRSMERVIREKKLSLETVLDYPAMSQLFSPNDLAVLVALQSHEGVKHLHADSRFALLDKWVASCKQGQSVELDSTIVPLSRSTTVLACLDDQIELPVGTELDKEASPVQVYDLATDVFIIVVDTGVRQYLMQSQNEMAVARVVMKVLMLYQPLHVVAKRSERFKRWLRLIATQSVLRPPQPVIV